MLTSIVIITLVNTAINLNLFIKLLMFQRLEPHRLIVQKVENPNLNKNKKKKFQKYNIKKRRIITKTKTKIIIPITDRNRDKIICL